MQEDGEVPSLQDTFAKVGCVRYEANYGQLGTAMTRNLALYRAAGDLVQVLDADAVLLPGAIAALIPQFKSPQIHWAVGQADDLMPDGSRVSWESVLEYGPIPAGLVNRWAEQHSDSWPIHCASLMARTVSLQALGGWIDLPEDDDIAMLAALSEIADGYNFEGVTWLYRLPARHAARRSRYLSQTSRTFAMQRARAVRMTGMSFHGESAE